MHRTNVVAINEFVLIKQQPKGIGKVNIMNLTLDEAKVLREQLDDAIDDANLNKENGEA